jgi:hypothetical protein
MVAPVTTLAMPPINSQIALFVGEPVKKREKSDPREFEALIPKMIRTIPKASSANPNGFIVIFLSLVMYPLMDLILSLNHRSLPR